MSVLQVLQQPRTLVDNVQLTTAVLGHIQGLAAQERLVRLNWVPSHVGLHGNEAADEAAREGTIQPAVTFTVLPSVQRAKMPSAKGPVPRSSSIASWYRPRSRQPGTPKPLTTNRYAHPAAVPSRRSCPTPTLTLLRDLGGA
ncbi:hypothetical protein GWK47_048116 [Chionoecetes opilio]|uniref:RNase H type-1 domain-containing protein n=1 Tax=Chionoecetes opilio TaxID=41210 RepID=A0A8J4YCA7_CHIOP|nr:hypothetical protein GWK47_048116 [Chionoecetes opilio]